MMNRRFISQALVMTIVAVVCLTGCHKETEEDRIKNMIAGIQKAAGEKDARAVLGHLSKTYHDPQGNNYDGVKGLLLFYFMKHRQVHVYVPDLVVSIENNAARASFQAVLTGAGSNAEAGAGLLPEALGVYAFTVVMQKESDAWKITSAAWERIGEGPAPKE
jgi:ketosteroid isomerase-like protein